MPNCLPQRTHAGVARLEIIDVAVRPHIAHATEPNSQSRETPSGPAAGSHASHVRARRVPHRRALTSVAMARAHAAISGGATDNRGAGAPVGPGRVAALDQRTRIGFRSWWSPPRRWGIILSRIGGRAGQSPRRGSPNEPRAAVQTKRTRESSRFQQLRFCVAAQPVQGSGFAGVNGVAPVRATRLR